jgi:hypothetical protein
MHCAPRRPDVADQRFEERAVLEDFHGVAWHGHAERHARKRCDQLVEGRVGVELEVRILVPLDGPDGDSEQGNRRQQHRNDEIHRKIRLFRDERRLRPRSCGLSVRNDTRPI